MKYPVQKLTAVLLVVGCCVLVSVMYWKSTSRKWVVQAPPTNTFISEISNGTDLFQDPFLKMTIPALRAREFNSELGVREEYAQTTFYTSYLTSYDSDGLKINGLLTIPKGEEPAGGWPAIVFVHGYIAPSVYQTTQKYEDYFNYLASHGFVVFKIDLRGHDESEGEAGGAYYSSDYVIDTLNARSALQSATFVNESRVGLWGHSMAGNVTFRAFVAAQDIPAVVIWAGAVYTYEDWQEYGISDNSYRPPGTQSDRQRQRQELFDTHGMFDPKSEFWQQVVPTNYLDGVTGSVALHHAQNDTVVDIGYSENLDKILTEKNVEHELWEYESGGHNLSSPAFSTAMQRTVEFYEEEM